MQKGRQKFKDMRARERSRRKEEGTDEGEAEGSVEGHHCSAVHFYLDFAPVPKFTSLQFNKYFLSTYYVAGFVLGLGHSHG